LHRRTGRVTGAATNTLLFVDFKRGFAVYQRWADSCHRTARYHGRAFTDIGDQVMIDFGWFGVLDVDRDITLATTVDLAA
jgi:hypothetical protein